MRWTLVTLLAAAVAQAGFSTAGADVPRNVAFACVYELKHKEGSAAKVTRCNEEWTDGDQTLRRTFNWFIDQIPGAGEGLDIVTKLVRWAVEGETAPVPGFVSGKVVLGSVPN
jgi:hypothetical protein